MINNAILGVIAGQIRASSPPPGPVNPPFGNVSSLLHFNGTDGSIELIDVTGKSWSRIALQPTLTTATSVFGGSSANWNDGRYISPTSADEDFNIGAGDFTIEMWIRVTDGSTTRYFFGRAGAAPNISMRRASTGEIIMTMGATSVTSAVLPLNTWAFVALSRSSGTAHCYLNSTRFASFASADVFATGVVPALGNYGNNSIVPASSGLIGQIDDFRFTKGIGLYAGATLYVPDVQFPDS